MNNKLNLLIILILVQLVTAIQVRSNDYDILGKIESKRKTNITIIFEIKPLLNKYYILNNKNIIGSIRILTINNYKSDKYNFRAVAKYTLENSKYKNLIRIGTNIALTKKKEISVLDYPKFKYKEKISYKKTIISKIDKRIMIFVPEGKFIFGSNNGDADEFPEQVVYLDNYYIDKFEVSNNDYKVFVDATNTQTPLSWENKKFDKKIGNFPVLVTYHEATLYAKWVNKRLPTEEEWEKGARGTGNANNKDNQRIIIYPWGNRFNSKKLNSIEFWTNDNVGKHIKEKFNGKVGLLPVDSFKREGRSPYGVLNMSGNASEWTSSWYLPYKNNIKKDRCYGKQYKVVRGGSYYDNWYKVRVTNRSIGGLPNLYKDNLSGFRCVRSVQILDKK